MLSGQRKIEKQNKKKMGGGGRWKRKGKNEMN